MVQTLLGDAVGKGKGIETGAPRTSKVSLENTDKDFYYLIPAEFHTWMGQAKSEFFRELGFRKEYLQKELQGEKIELRPTRKEFNIFVGDPKPVKEKGVIREGITTHPFFAALWRHDQKRWKRAVSELWQLVHAIIEP